MNDDLREQLAALEHAIADLAAASKRALGFVCTIEYMGIAFNVSRRFVIAELSPLAYFHLVEHVCREYKDDSDKDGVGNAIVRLYDRLLPLLSCIHQWTPLSRADDAHLRDLGVGKSGSSRPHICKACTAYALEGSLPVVGRTLQPWTPM